MQDQATLDKYSKSMKSLATSYWEKSGEESRVEWVKNQVLSKYPCHLAKTPNITSLGWVGQETGIFQVSLSPVQIGGELIYPKLPKTKKTQCYQTFSGAVLCIKAGENFEFGERWHLTPCTWGLKIWKSPLKIEISKLFYYRHVGCLSRGIEGRCSKINFFPILL